MFELMMSQGQEKDAGEGGVLGSERSICKGPEAGKGLTGSENEKESECCVKQEAGPRSAGQRLCPERSQVPGLAPRCLRVFLDRVGICCRCVALGQSCPSLSLCPPLDNGQPSRLNARSVCTKCTWSPQDTRSFLPPFLTSLICLEGLWPHLQVGLGQGQSLRQQGYCGLQEGWTPAKQIISYILSPALTQRPKRGASPRPHGKGEESGSLPHPTSPPLPLSQTAILSRHTPDCSNPIIHSFPCAQF